MDDTRILLPEDHCPCGSGKNIICCCFPEGREYIEGPNAPVLYRDHIPEELLERVRQETLRRATFGDIRPVIHADWQGKKWVAVGNQFFGGNWRFFPDFLSDYIKFVLSPAWGNAEIAKPLADRHPIMQWYDGKCRFEQLQPKASDGTLSFLPDGCTQAYILLAYDLYALRHHQSLQAIVVDRLKNKDQFQGARHELFATATCIRAGYDIQFEDEQDRSRKHPEFRATHRPTKVTLTVEAKSRHRKGVLGQPGTQESPTVVGARIGQLLNSALKKAGITPYVVFIDVNVPPSDQSPFEKLWFKDVLRSLEASGFANTSEPDPFNLIVFTNHPFHYVSPGVDAPSPETITMFGRNPRIPVSDGSSLVAIHDAAVKFGRIPQEFDDAE